MSLRPKYYRSRPERFGNSTLKQNSRNAPFWDAEIDSALLSGVTLILTFDRPVILSTAPRPTGIQTDVGATEVSAAQTADDVVQITYDASVAAATAIILPNPSTNAVRSRDGGFIRPATFPPAS